MPSGSDPTRLERAAGLMTRHNVEFIVIGGQAEYLFGSPRVTYDVDLCYRRTPANLERLAAALWELKPSLRGAPPGLPINFDARTLSLGSNFTLQTVFGDLDRMGWVEPIGDYEALAPRVETYDVGSLRLQVISLEDLIRVKEHLGRSKDRDSLYQLMAIRRVREEERRG